MDRAVAFVLKGYPRLSETFIAQEIHALERRGLDIRLYSMRLPTDPHVHPMHAEIKAAVTYLPEYLYREPARVWRAWRALRRSNRYAAARRQWLTDLGRDPTPNRMRRFGQALVLAHELPPEVDWIHAHFLHTPASVARYAAMLTGLPWSCSAHAKDIWTLPEWEKAEKLSDARWLVTCTRYNADHLAALAPQPDCVELVYHGLDFSRFAEPPPARPARDGADPNDPVVIVSVGRAVAKKGYADLLDALARVPDDLNWRMVHIGGGALLDKLKAQARRLGLEERIEWLGPRAQADVLNNYAAADLFVLASRIAPDGDRDGLPNVLMEAQSQGLACLATRVSAVPELIIDGMTGVLVETGDIAALADALARLIGDPHLRLSLGKAGMKRVRAEFTCEKGIDILARRFGLRPVGTDDCESRFMRH